MPADTPGRVLLNDTNGFELTTKSAQADVLPGMLVEYVGEDGAQPHSTAAAAVRPRIAVENFVVGKQLDTPYLAGEDISLIHGSTGSGRRFYMPLADGAVVAMGDGLVSNGDGTVRPAAGDGTEADGVFGEAYEDVSATDDFEAGEQPRVRVEI